MEAEFLSDVSADSGLKKINSAGQIAARTQELYTKDDKNYFVNIFKHLSWTVLLLGLHLTCDRAKSKFYNCLRVNSFDNVSFYCKTDI